MSFAIVTLIFGWMAIVSVAGTGPTNRPLGQPLTKRQPSMANGITIDMSAASRLRETFREYAEWNEKDLRQTAIDKARVLAGGISKKTEHGTVDGLYQTTAAVAPSEGRIEADVRARGWRIPEFFSKGAGGGMRIGRGLPRMWAHFAFKAARKGKRGRATKGDLAIRDDPKPTLGQMQAFVIAMRIRARKYLASGWLGSIADLGGNSPRSEISVDHERGGADIRESQGLLEVEFWNRTPGIEEVNARYGFAQEAINNSIADMEFYIARKKEEAQNFMQHRGGVAA